MDNNIINSVYESLKESTPGVVEAAAEYNAIEDKIKSNRYSRDTLNNEIYPKRDMLRESLETKTSDALKKARGLVEQYRQDAADRETLNPAELTDDIKLLQSGISLNTKDIKGMLKRNTNNRTMSQIILRYAADHNIDTGGVIYVGGEAEAETAKHLDEIISIYGKWINQPNAQETLDEIFNSVK